MKRQLALWAARTTAADRLCRGSALVWQRRADALTTWVRAGRREDLTGWRAALGPLVRLVLLGALAYAVWAILRALPWLMWLLAGWWIRAAWKAGKATVAEADDSAPTEPDVEAVRTLLLEVMGDDSAVHLSTVLAHLQERGQGEGWTVADLRARLVAMGIPVHPKVKAAGRGPTRGVRRVDLVPSSAGAAEASTAPSTAA